LSRTNFDYLELRMITDEQKGYIQHLSGSIELPEDGSLIKTAYNHLVRSQGASGSTQSSIEDFSFAKEAQGVSLIGLSDSIGVTLPHPSSSLPYLTEGGEAKIYFDRSHVVKLNSGVFYQDWIDFLCSVLVHNCLFPVTQYDLLGFCKGEKEVAAVLSQVYVRCDQATFLPLVEEYLSGMGFLRERRNDYYHSGLNLVLEDMHDENVLIREGYLFFIDTVFYFRDQ